MAVIQFTESDVLQTTVIEAGIYPCEVPVIKGPQKSASGKSVSYFTDIVITEGKFKGKTRTIVFNSETSSYSLLGDMQFYPQAAMLDLKAAIDNAPKEPCNLDTDLLLHKPFDAQWAVETVEGKLINTIVNFYPAGYSNSVPKF